MSEKESDESALGFNIAIFIFSIVSKNASFNSCKLKLFTISSIYNISSGFDIIIIIFGSLQA